MSIKVWVTSITFNDDTTVPVEEGQITVLVGPNNAGKSASLKELYAYLTKEQDQFNGSIITNFSLGKEGTVEQVREKIKGYGKLQPPYYHGIGFQVHESFIETFWKRENNRLYEVGKFFTQLLTTEVRLQAVEPPNSIDYEEQPVSHPVQLLFRNSEIAEKFSRYFKQAFGLDLFIDYLGGSKVLLRVGHKPIPLDGEDRVDYDYSLRIKSHPRLYDQGDGMKSFVGVLLYTFLTHHHIHFIDEPEAFLHPPQARIMGKMLGRDLPEEKQLFIATHSSDLLGGLLEAKSANIQIIRISRDNNINRISRLPNEAILQVWSNSLLRHSNVFEGIFHSKVVLCEGDADCRFYSAVLDAVYEKDSKSSPDVHFIHCGGKHRMDVVIKALHQLDVPLTVIADFDVLNDEQPLRKIYEALGGTWDDIQKNWNIVKKAVDGKKAPYDIDTAKNDIRAALNEVTHKEFPSKTIKRINH